MSSNDRYVPQLWTASQGGPADPSCKETYHVPAFPSRTPIFVISDLHLIHAGAQPAHEERIEHLLDHLLKMKKALPQGACLPFLVLLGDIFDDWAQPHHTLPLPLSQVMKRHWWLLNKLDELSSDFMIVYVRGNHDMDLHAKMFGPTVEFEGLEDDQIVFKKVYFGGDRLILGDDVVLEHGHRYDLTNTTRFGHVAYGKPPGYFLTRLAASNGVYDHPFSWIMKVLGGWRFAVKTFDYLAKGGIMRAAVNTAREEIPDSSDFLVAGGGTFKVGEIVKLFERDMYRNPTEDLKLNSCLVPMFSRKRSVTHPEDELRDGILTALGVMSHAADQYAPFFRLAVFGHTHEPGIEKRDVDGEEVYYVNAGASKQSTELPNFVVIDYPEQDDCRVRVLEFEPSGEGKGTEVAGETIPAVRVAPSAQPYHGTPEGMDLERLPNLEWKNPYCFVSESREPGTYLCRCTTQLDSLPNCASRATKGARRAVGEVLERITVDRSHAYDAIVKRMLVLGDAGPAAEDPRAQAAHLRENINEWLHTVLIQTSDGGQECLNVEQLDRSHMFRSMVEVDPNLKTHLKIDVEDLSHAELKTLLTWIKDDRIKDDIEFPLLLRMSVHASKYGETEFLAKIKETLVHKMQEMTTSDIAAALLAWQLQEANDELKRELLELVRQRDAALGQAMERSMS